MDMTRPLAASRLGCVLLRDRPVPLCVPPQERTGVKMVMIQDGPLPTGADKPLRITGDPFKVQVGEELGQAGPGVGVPLGSSSFKVSRFPRPSLMMERL